MNLQLPLKNDPPDISLQVSWAIPNVIREISGIYPTFVSAIKELINNSYDADATQVTIQVSPDLKQIIIEDNGAGITPFEFQNVYLRVGASTQTEDGLPTAGGRKPIGQKGIGFLAVSRYCSRVEIISHAKRKVSVEKTISMEQHVDRHDARAITFLQEPLEMLLAPYTSIRTIRGGTAELGSGEFNRKGITIYFPEKSWDRLIASISVEPKPKGKEFSNHQPQSVDRPKRQITIQYYVDCDSFNIQASIDYDKLLNSINETNIDSPQDYCQFHLDSGEDANRNHFTKVVLYLHDFVQHQLVSTKRKGRVRNISSTSGLDQFIWNLSRSIPVSYDISLQELESCNLELLAPSTSPTPFEVKILGVKKEAIDLRRPFWGEIKSNGLEKTQMIRIPLILDSDALLAKGYLLGFLQPIFPAELRGIAIRVHGVEIGQPNFLGIEKEIPVKYRPFLRQVMGEVNVIKGLEAVRAIMPGREGFYAESKQFQTLRNLLVGDGSLDLGILGRALIQIRDHRSVKSSVERIVQENKQRRNAFLDISQALSGLLGSSNYGHHLRDLFFRSNIVANRLNDIPEYTIKLPKTIGNYALELSNDLEYDYDIDLCHKVAKINSNSDIWDSSLYTLGRDFTISLRAGKPSDPVCEIDFSTNEIFLNWTHPTRTKLGDVMFIKSSLSWLIGYHASKGDINLMMNLAHRILSFAT